MTPTQLNALINWLDMRIPLMRELARQDRGLTPSDAMAIDNQIEDLDNELREHFVERK